MGIGKKGFTLVEIIVSLATVSYTHLVFAYLESLGYDSSKLVKRNDN